MESASHSENSATGRPSDCLTLPSISQDTVTLVSTGLRLSPDWLLSPVGGSPSPTYVTLIVDQLNSLSQSLSMSLEQKPFPMAALLTRSAITQS